MKNAKNEVNRKCALIHEIRKQKRTHTHLKRVNFSKFKTRNFFKFLTVILRHQVLLTVKENVVSLTNVYSYFRYFPRFVIFLLKFTSFSFSLFFFQKKGNF